RHHQDVYRRHGDQPNLDSVFGMNAYPQLLTSMGLVHFLASISQSTNRTVMNVYLWDKAANEFYCKFSDTLETPTLPICWLDLSYLFYIPFVNPSFKATGNVALSYIDKHVGSNPDVSAVANASEVTKVAKMTIFAFPKHEPTKVLSRTNNHTYLQGTIDDVERDSNWYYIAGSDCQTKVNRGPTSLICPKCGNVKATGAAKYRTELSVYDNDDKTSFVLLGDAGNGDMGAHYEKPTQQSLVVTIGQTRNFRVTVPDYNFTTKSRLYLSLSLSCCPASCSTCRVDPILLVRHEPQLMSARRRRKPSMQDLDIMLGRRRSNLLHFQRNWLRTNNPSAFNAMLNADHKKRPTAEAVLGH
ncbi:LOW QUALITY PROTEIN: hypothetical protein HID58_080751, partial [Brassica napus]